MPYEKWRSQVTNQSTFVCYPLTNYMCLVTIPLQVNQRQRLFVHHYVANGGNATAAAREAGYRGTDGAIRVQAHRMLTSVNVQNAIDEHQQQFAKSAEGLKLSPDWGWASSGPTTTQRSRISSTQQLTSSLRVSHHPASFSKKRPSKMELFWAMSI